MKKIVLFVEGEGEAEAAPILINKLLNETPQVWQHLSLDPHPFRVGEINRILKGDNWTKKLKAALLRGDVGGVLLLLDGDVKVAGKPLCAAALARNLAATASVTGAGEIFSVAVVFAIKEFESWLIASYESLEGKSLPDGRRIPAATELPPDVEASPRDAKKWWKDRIGKYKPTMDQADLTRLVAPASVRANNVRSFRRLESAVSALAQAIISGDHIATPTS